LVGALSVFAASLEVREADADVSLEARGGGNGLPSGWKVVNQCVEDQGNNRVFFKKGKVLPKLTVQRNVLGNNSPSACANRCAQTNFPYAAVRMGVECWCSNQAPQIRPKPKGQCSQPCAGDKNKTCGSFSTSQVYVNWGLVNKKRPNVGQPKLANGWSVAFKCVADPTVGEKFLKGTDVFELQNNTPLACTKLCGQKGYALAGVEYSNECMCGNDWKNSAPPAKKDEKECNMSCTGDKTLTCGAGHRVQFYKHQRFRRFNTTLDWDVASFE
jgi:hypothetical protein